MAFDTSEEIVTGLGCHARFRLSERHGRFFLVVEYPKDNVASSIQHLKRVLDLNRA